MCLAEEGAFVHKDDVILQIECFKMFFDTKAPVDGKIEWLVKLGQLVEENQVVAYVMTNRN